MFYLLQYYTEAFSWARFSHLSRQSSKSRVVVAKLLPQFCCWPCFLMYCFAGKLQFRISLFTYRESHDYDLFSMDIDVARSVEIFALSTTIRLFTERFCWLVMTIDECYIGSISCCMSNLQVKNGWWVFFKNAKIVIEDLLYVIFMVSKMDIEVVSVLIVCHAPASEARARLHHFFCDDLCKLSSQKSVGIKKTKIMPAIFRYYRATFTSEVICLLW